DVDEDVLALRGGVQVLVAHLADTGLHVCDGDLPVTGGDGVAQAVGGGCFVCGVLGRLVCGVIRVVLGSGVLVRRRLLGGLGVGGLVGSGGVRRGLVASTAGDADDGEEGEDRQDPEPPAL